MGSEYIFTEVQQGLIVGTLLGDGSLERRWKNTRLRIDHTIAQREYVLWKYDALQDVATRKPTLLCERDKRSGKIGVRLYFSTKAMLELNQYYDLFYPDGKKRIGDWVLRYCTHPIALAVWLMDDGYKRNDCDAIRLSTDSFSFEEHLILQKLFKKNFNIESRLHKKKNAYNIYIPKKEMEKMRLLLDPYVITSMKYKLRPVTTSPTMIGGIATK